MAKRQTNLKKEKAFGGCVRQDLGAWRGQVSVRKVIIRTLKYGGECRLRGGED